MSDYPFDLFERWYRQSRAMTCSFNRLYQTRFREYITRPGKPPFIPSGFLVDIQGFQIRIDRRTP